MNFLFENLWISWACNMTHELIRFLRSIKFQTQFFFIYLKTYFHHQNRRYDQRKTKFPKHNFTDFCF